MKKENKTKKNNKTLKIVLLTLCCIIVLFFLIAGAFIISLQVRYNKYSYEYQPPVDREKTFVMPDYVELDETCESPDDTIVPEYFETTSQNNTAETAEIPESAAVSETEYEPATTPYPEITEEPETLPAEVNTSSAPSAPPANPDASFANSPNMISVYGDTPIYKVKQKDPDILNILVMGTDSRDVTYDRGRSDTMILVSLNQKTGDIKLTSILRDSLVPVSGHGWDRINVAYFFGGVGLALNTVNDLFDLDVQQFVVIDFNGTKNLANKIGGADITLTQAEADLYNAYWGTNYTEGVNHLNGEHLLGHMQNREIGNDFERTRRQRDVILVLLNKIMTEMSISEIYDLIDYSFNIVKTNISFSSLSTLLTSIISNYSNLSFEMQSVPYSDSYRFAWYEGKAIISFDIEDAAERINAFIYN